MALHRVVILGGGFGGLYAAQALKHAEVVDVTLIDRRNHHLFQPLLYQVATGSLSPGEVAAPLRSILSGQKNTRVLLGEAVSLDAANRTLILKDGSVALRFADRRVRVAEFLLRAHGLGEGRAGAQVH